MGVRQGFKGFLGYSFSLLNKSQLIPLIQYLYKHVENPKCIARFRKVKHSYPKHFSWAFNAGDIASCTFGTQRQRVVAEVARRSDCWKKRLLKGSTAEPVSNDFKVGVFLSGADDIDMRREVFVMLYSAGLPMKKWASNSVEVVEDNPPEDRSVQPCHDLQDSQSVSMLGLI